MIETYFLARVHVTNTFDVAGTDDADADTDDAVADTDDDASPCADIVVLARTHSDACEEIKVIAKTRNDMVLPKTHTGGCEDMVDGPK